MTSCNEIYQKTGGHNPWKRVIEIGIWGRGHNNSFFCLPLSLILDSLPGVIDTSDWKATTKQNNDVCFLSSLLFFQSFLPHCATVPLAHSSTFHKRHSWIIEVAGRGECGLKWKRASSMTHCLFCAVDLHDCLSFPFVHFSLCPSMRHLVCLCVTHLFGLVRVGQSFSRRTLPFMMAIFNQEHALYERVGFEWVPSNMAIILVRHQVYDHNATVRNIHTFFSKALYFQLLLYGFWNKWYSNSCNFTSWNCIGNCILASVTSEADLF